MMVRYAKNCDSIGKDGLKIENYSDHINECPLVGPMLRHNLHCWEC